MPHHWHFLQTVNWILYSCITHILWVRILYSEKPPIFPLLSYILNMIIPPPQNVGWGGYTGFALSRRSIGPSVRLPIHFRSITLLLMEGFPSNLNDTFTSTRECAEPIFPMFQLKVTVKGQIFNKQILDIS